MAVCGGFDGVGGSFVGWVEVGEMVGGVTFLTMALVIGGLMDVVGLRTMGSFDGLLTRSVCMDGALR